MMSLLELFVSVDDFCQTFLPVRDYPASRTRYPKLPLQGVQVGISEARGAGRAFQAH